MPTSLPEKRYSGKAMGEGDTNRVLGQGWPGQPYQFG